jgi:hypothetical protein
MIANCEVIMGEPITQKSELINGTIDFENYTITTDTNVLVTIPANPDPKYILTSQSGEILISQDSFNLRSQQGDDATIVIDVDETMRDGSTDAYTIEILQE